MAIHAAMITRMDTEIGKLLKQVEARRAFDDTVVIFLSDNGASSEQLIRGDGHEAPDAQSLRPGGPDARGGEKKFRETGPRTVGVSPANSR
jgi:arylsulfatase A-like enzyme